MNKILEQIRLLSRDQAIEAAIFVSNTINEENKDEGAQEVADVVKEKPFEYLEDVENLSRLILVNAAEDDEYIELVRNAIENTGKKALILGGAEIVALAFAGVGALRIIMNPVKKKTKKVKKADGSTEEITEEHDTDLGFLSPLFRSLVKHLK
jgi:hypothetical protein